MRTSVLCISTNSDFLSAMFPSHFWDTNRNASRKVVLCRQLRIFAQRKVQGNCRHRRCNRYSCVTRTVSVYLNSMKKERFLLMAVATENENNEDFMDAWKRASDDARVEHKLRCTLADGTVVVKPDLKQNKCNPVRDEGADNTVSDSVQ